MPGETNLSALIKSMDPILLEGSFVFVSIPYNEQETLGMLFSSSTLPMGTFTENEGYSVILKEQEASKLGLSFDGLFACITLNIHSSLDAVGLTAAIATCLSEHNISANVVAAYFHDHVFIAQEDASRALQALQALSAQAS